MLDFLSYYRSFVPNFACKAKPLYNLLVLSKSKPHNPEQLPKKQKNLRKIKVSYPFIHRHSGPQGSPNQLIKALTKAPILGYLNFDQPFALHCDASQDGLGAVLYQWQQGKMRVVDYGSHSRSPSEEWYHSGKLEFLALK